MKLFAAELIVLATVIILFVFDTTLIVIKGIQLDYVGYFLCGMAGVGVFALGQLYRNRGRDLHIATALISSGLFILFSLVGAVFNYMFLPVAFPAIDPVLIRVDSALGYSWPDMVTWAATYPWVGKMLFLVYATSLPQLLLIIVTLGFTGKDRMLHHFIVTGVMGAMASIIFWIFFPTYGAKAYYELPQWVTQAIPLMVDPAYGRELMRLGQEGVAYLSPKNVLGLIGFPSFHIFMAAMSVWFVPRHWLAIAVILPLNLLMLPAVLVQGGHHLSDVFGGLIAFAVVCVTSRRLLDWLSARERMDEAATVPA